MSGLELAVVALAALSCIALAGVAASLLQVRALRRTLAREPSREPSRELLTVHPPVQPDAGVRFVPSVVAEASLPAEPVLVHPLVRAAAVAHGLRCALAPANRDRIRSLVRRDIRRRQKLRMQAARRAARVLPTDPAG